VNVANSFRMLFRRFGLVGSTAPRGRSRCLARTWLAVTMLENRDVPAASWTQITSVLPDPGAGVSTATLLPNGDVLGKQGQVQIGVDQQGHPIYSENTSGNYLLTPDAGGNYADGTWSRAASMNVSRLFYPSNVLPNGNLFVFGGEVTGSGGDGNTSEIYDPQANSWSFTSSTFPQRVGGDDPTEVLPNGQVLVGSINSSQNIPLHSCIRHKSGRLDCNRVEAQRRYQLRGKLGSANGWKRVGVQHYIELGGSTIRSPEVNRSR
jgi:hypothetical protein